MRHRKPVKNVWSKNGNIVKKCCKEGRLQKRKPVNKNMLGKRKPTSINLRNRMKDSKGGKNL